MSEKSKRRTVVAVAGLVALVGIILAVWLTVDRKGLRVGDSQSNAVVEIGGVRSVLEYKGEVAGNEAGTDKLHSWQYQEFLQADGRIETTKHILLTLRGQPGQWQVKGQAMVAGESRWEIPRTPWKGPGEYAAEVEDLRTGEKSPTTVKVTIRGVP